MLPGPSASGASSGVRSFHLKDGAHLRERLLSFSDVERSFSYNFEKTPFSVLNYHATLRVTPVTDGGRTFAEWSAEFDCEPRREQELSDLIGGQVFQGGFDALKKHFRAER